MAKRTKRLILPFAVSSKERFRPFTKDMEMAAIYYLSERDRKKGEGRVLKKPEETLLFIAETCYPLWLIPWTGRTLIFDGLEFTNETISYNVLPNIKAFEADILASSKSREAYIAALTQNANYFQNFAGKEEKTIEGLVTFPEFIHDIIEYLPDAQDIGKAETTKAVLTPKLDESEVSASVEKLTDVKQMLKEEISSLGGCMKLLSKASRDQVKALHAEMKKSEKEFKRKITKLQPKVAAKIKKIQEKRDEEITRISKKYDRKLRTLHQNRVKAEKTLERLATEIERIDTDIKTCRGNKDEAGEFQLSQNLDEIKKQIPLLNKEIKDIDRKLENVEDAKKIEVSRARTKPNHRIEEANKCLHDVEAAKEARARLEEQDLATLEDLTASIIKQIDAMIKNKEATLDAIEDMGFEERRRKQALLYVPVYFVCYETEVGKRYVIYPPSTICSLGIKTKLKGVFGAGKIKSFLQSRSTAIAALVDRLIDLIQENPVFEKEIIDAGIKANILGTTERKVGVKRGIVELQEEGWISEDEVEFQDENGEKEQ
jgi:hypothetical protein